MKGTVFSADFVKDSNGNLRLLELNTDTGFIGQELVNFDFSGFLSVLSSTCWNVELSKSIQRENFKNKKQWIFSSISSFYNLTKFNEKIVLKIIKVKEF